MDYFIYLYKNPILSFTIFVMTIIVNLKDLGFHYANNHINFPVIVYITNCNGCY